MNKNFDEKMSLLLDGMLEQEEEERFYKELMDDPVASKEWQGWQNLDSLLTWTPSAIPNADFVDKCSLRLIHHERQRRLRQGLVVGVLALLLWGSMLVGAFTLSSAFMAGEGNGLSVLFQKWGYSLQNAGLWLDTLSSSLGTIVTMPQAFVIGFCYLALTTFLLWKWGRLLKRTVYNAKTLS